MAGACPSLYEAEEPLKIACQDVAHVTGHLRMEPHASAATAEVVVVSPIQR